VPRLCVFYPGICLTTEEKARKTLSQGKKNLSQVKKNLSQSTVYILPKHPNITKPTQTHTLQKTHTHTHTHHTHTTHTHTHTHTHTLQNNIKPPKYKLKQTLCKIYPNEIVGNLYPAVCLYASCPRPMAHILWSSTHTYLARADFSTI
jgi:NADH dehydrogenase FAD-containing subunit